MDTHLQTKTPHCRVTVSINIQFLCNDLTNFISLGFLISSLHAFKWWLPKNWPMAMWSMPLPLSTMKLFLSAISSDQSCHFSQVQSNGEPFSTNTYCITFGCFSLLRLILSLYYTVLRRNLHKGGALIIHDSRFRFVPRSSEMENSAPCYFAEELRISVFRFDSTALKQALVSVDCIA